MLARILIPEQPRRDVVLVPPRFGTATAVGDPVVSETPVIEMRFT